MENIRVIHTVRELMKDCLKNILYTTLSGIFLAIIFFLWNDFFIKPYDLSGCWKAKLHIEESKYPSFENLTIEFDYHLIQIGESVSGEGEKIKEYYPNQNTKEYTGKNRTTVLVNGGIRTLYFGKDTLNLQLSEHGKIRNSSGFLKLKMVSSNLLKGKFVSTVANSKGHVVLERYDDVL